MDVKNQVCIPYKITLKERKDKVCRFVEMGLNLLTQRYFSRLRSILQVNGNGNHAYDSSEYQH